MKTLLSFLMTISCAALLSAADLYYGSFAFLSGKDSLGEELLPVCYRYALDDVATQGEVNEPLAKNEILRVCIVRDKRGANVNEYTAPAVAVDAAGQLVCADCGTTNFAQHLSLANGSACTGNATGAKWLDLNWTEFGTTTTVTAEYATVGDVLGVPANFLANVGDFKKYGFDVSTDADVEKADGKAYKVYMYLVAMDTRTGASTCEGLPKHVKSYAMAICYGTATQTYVEASPASPRAWLVNASDGKSIFTPSPGRELAWQPSAEVKSLVVDGKTLTGDALIAYLTPSVSKMTTSENALSLTVDAPDVQYYTLYTKAALTDEEWVSFEEFVANDENLVDKINGKSYTRFRIGGESPSILQIPLISDEASRFYILRGE